MRKILYLILFFIIAGGIFYITRSVDPQKGLTVREIGRIISGKVSKEDGEKILNSLKSVDISKLDASKQKEFLKFIEGENLLQGDRLKNFISASKNLQGSAKELYYKILYSTYKADPPEFLKIVSNFKTEEISTVFKAFADKYIEKPELIQDFQDIMKDNKLTKEQKDKLRNLVENIKKKY